MNERTYIMIKPSGVQRGLVGEIIKRFEQKGLRLNALKIIQVNKLTKLNLITNDRLYLSKRQVNI